MARKKGVKKSSVKKLPVASSIVSSRKMQMQQEINTQKYVKKKKIALKKLVLFAIISIVFWALYNVTPVAFIGDIFWVIAMLSGFIALAFLIVFLVFLVLKIMNK